MSTARSRWHSFPRLRSSAWRRFIRCDARKCRSPKRSIAFFGGNTIWLVWILVLMVTVAVVPVTEQAHLDGPVLISSMLPILWSVAVDRRFFAEVMGRTGWHGALDITIERLVAWLAAMLYFLGVALDGRLGEMFYLFVEMRDAVVAWATS